MAPDRPPCFQPASSSTRSPSTPRQQEASSKKKKAIPGGGVRQGEGGNSAGEGGKAGKLHGLHFRAARGSNADSALPARQPLDSSAAETGCLRKGTPLEP